MKIEQAAVAMQASHEYTSEYEYAVASAISFRSVFAGAEAQAEAAAESETADASQTGASAANEVAAPTTASATDSARSSEQQRLLLLLAQIVGRLLDYLAPRGTSSSTESGGVAALDSGVALPAAAATGGYSEYSGARPRLVMEWSRVAIERIEEHESSDFTSSGTIVTADGRELDFTLGLSLCRDYSCVRTAVEAGSVELCDPLVINFDGKAAELADQCFAFDLDANGSCEMLPELVGGSGYLAIDRNGDGRINDGSELFGTASGDGFSDLAALDADGNHWLDESDAAFSALRVWQREAGADDSLRTLAEAGVGALYLGSTQTPYSLTDEDNRLLGQIRASGIYLNENGSAGTLQQIDLAV